jgi:hypothetical protein
MNLIVLEKVFSIYKFKNESVLPGWIYATDFYSITKTMDEMSVVAVQTDINSGEINVNRDWRVIKIEGPLDFSLIGIIADISAIFKKKRISIFTLSTYDTDYILIKKNDLKMGIQALLENGLNVSIENKKSSE